MDIFLFPFLPFHLQLFLFLIDTYLVFSYTHLQQEEILFGIVPIKAIKISSMRKNSLARHCERSEAI